MEELEEEKESVRGVKMGSQTGFSSLPDRIFFLSVFVDGRYAFYGQATGGVTWNSGVTAAGNATSTMPNVENERITVLHRVWSTSTLNFELYQHL